ncbi:MAG: peptide-methionine (S)-S-oxide reductase [Planctomycetes bacterium]|nr:peptide-methionine (S)-S-oxide reductase [Planctomycetota bacterium]
MLRTRVGYCGGQKQNPTYRDLGDHAETIEIDFDPKRITYERLLEVFWSSHNACRSPWSRQYMSAIFYHDAEQLAAVHRTRLRCVDTPDAIKTAIVPYEKFWLAEDYHQKYRLRHEPELAAELKARYGGDERAFVVSTAAARMNGWLDGYGDEAQLEREIGRLGLGDDAIARLRRHTR